MTAATAAERAVETPARGFADRLLAAVPILSVFVWAAALYVWQAWLVATPFIFTDELELTQLARSVAEDGTPARRGEPHGLSTLVAVLTAPAWLIEDTRAAYEVAKYLGAIAMASAALPAYALARLLVGRGPALVAAAGSVAVPGFAYSSLLLEEPWAYPAATLALYLTVRALTLRTRGALASAAGVCVLALLVRSQLAILLPVLAVAGVAVWWTTTSARRWRATWVRWDWVGVVVLGVGLVVLLNEVMSHASVTWQTAMRNYKDRTLEYGLWAGGAFAIGVGMLPVAVGIAKLVRSRDEPAGRARLAFSAVLAASLVAFGLYAAVKASYLSTVFATRVAERNLVYLAPLLFVAVALWLEQPRLRPAALAAGAGLTALLVGVVPLVLDFPYFEAPGFALPALLNRELEWAAGDIRTALWIAFAIAVGLAAAPLALRGRGRSAALVAGTAAALALAWNVAGQSYASSGFRTSADLMYGNLPKPADWVDRATGGAPTMYLGQNIKDHNGIWLTEFWNRSITYVWSLDATAPGPGATLTPDIMDGDGHLLQQRGEVQYVLADGGIDIDGKLVAAKRTVGGPPLRLFFVNGTVRLRSAAEGIFPDGWMGGEAAYTRYARSGSEPGILTVTLSRESWGGTDVPGRARVRLGEFAVDEDFHPTIGRVTETRECVLRAKTKCEFRLRTPAPPFRAEVDISPTFVPAKVNPGHGDARELGAVASFRFSPGG